MADLIADLNDLQRGAAESLGHEDAELITRSIDKIKGLEFDLWLMELARDQKVDLLESCEKALAGRDEQIGVLKSFLRSAINDGGASPNLKSCARDLLNEK